MASKKLPRQPQGEVADIALLLEGTYPYVRGGVSSWVHQIISGMPERTFSIAFLGGAREHYGEIRYELPPNVIHVEVHYLMESWLSMVPRPRRGNAKPFAQMEKLHEFFRSPESGISRELVTATALALGTKAGVPREDFLYSERAWERICTDYHRYCSDPSFVDYFWTVRTMHAPLFTLARIAHSLPPARVFHTVSTGYAGFLGMMLSNMRHKPLILSEHGIYTKERKIDLAHAEWIKEFRETFSGGLDERVSYIRRLWIRFFEGIGRLTYEAADPIVALFEGNRQRQIHDGAPAERTCNVPNGIDIERFSALRAHRSDKIPMVLGLLGRVVPIKDIRTFIRAVRTVCNRLPEAEGWVIGPEDEDEDYANECRDLVSSLGLDGRVKFLGFQKPADILPKMGLMTLTSISEGLPLVILEGYAAGLPVVATDVGSCRELVEGMTPEDRELGPSGRIVPIASPEATAQAALELLTDEKAWYAAQAAGIKRVESFYTQPQMFARYCEIYREALERSDGGHRFRAA